MAIRASMVVNNLPPGAASDKDIEMAMSGFPSENATGKQISTFLRGLSKVEQINSDFNEFKSEYLPTEGTERNLIQEWKKQSQESVSIDDLVKQYGE